MDVAILTEKLGWHLPTWANILGQSADVDKVFLSDPSQKNTDRIRQEVGDKLAGIYTSPEDLLRENQVELAVVTMAPINMPPACRTALEAGVHVIVEKPAATTPEAYAPLVDLANSKGLLLAMALDFEAPLVREASRIVKEGTRGKIYGMHYLWMDFQRWRIRHQIGWVFKKAEAGGGILGHLVCHAIHRLRRIMGQEVAEVTGFADVVCGEPLEVEDSAAMSVRFANGAVGTLHAGYWGPSPGRSAGLPPGNKPVQKHTFSIWGEKGALHADMAESKLVLDLQYEGPRKPAKDPADIGKGTRQLFIRRWETEVAYDGALDTFFQGCLKAIRGEGPPPNSNEDGLRFLEIQHAFYRASETGTTQRLQGK